MTRTHRRGSIRLRLVTLCALVSASAGAVEAVDLKHRFTLGGRFGNYFPADEQGGGFRYFGGFDFASERSVALGEVPLVGASFGYGLAQWQRDSGAPLQLSLEFEVSRLESDLGLETVYFDPDNSTRLDTPPFNRNQTGDERFERIALGDVTMTPVFVNALLHIAGRNDPERADFYFGAGLGLVLADLEESSAYREFAADVDGQPDVVAEDSSAVNVKAGANIRLSRGGNLYLYLEAQFFTTALISSDSQVKWSGVEYTGCTQEVDTNGDGMDDSVVAGCFQAMDSGKVRMDGGIGAIGLRYRFGGGARAASEAVTDDEAVDPPVVP